MRARRLEKGDEKSYQRFCIVIPYLTCSLVTFLTEVLNNLLLQSELTQGKVD